jgi:hypothetical protein
MRFMMQAAARYRLVPWQDLEAGDVPIAATHAEGWLRTWLVDPHHRGEVLEALQSLTPAHRQSKGWMDDRELGAYVRPRLERALRTGELVLVERQKLQSWKPMLQEPDEATDKIHEREPSAPTKTWIEFLVNDDDDKPLEGVRYEAHLTDGSKKTGVTGETGLVRFDQIDAGICEFILPDFDAKDVESEDEPAHTEPLEIQLLDAEGKGIAKAEVVVRLMDGTKKNVVTDKDGKAKIEGLTKGEYELSFPSLAQHS